MEINTALKSAIDNHIMRECVKRLGKTRVNEIMKNHDAEVAKHNGKPGIPQSLVEVRAEAGYGQPDVAEELGTTTYSVSGWINNPGMTPRRAYRANMKRVLGVNPYASKP